MLNSWFIFGMTAQCDIPSSHLSQQAPDIVISELVNVLKFQTLYSIPFLAWILFFMQLFLKILCGKINSVDPDQTAPEGAVWSGSALFAYTILSDTLVYEILRHLPYCIYPKYLDTSTPNYLFLYMYMYWNTVDFHFLKLQRTRNF